MKIQISEDIIRHKEKKEKKFISPLEKQKTERKDVNNKIIFYR